MLKVPTLSTKSLLKKPTPLPRFQNGHWHFPEQMGDGVGFIYVIRDAYLRRFYLGQKRFKGTGKINGGKESNWRNYKTSSKLMADLFKERPLDEFEFICIEQYKTKGCLTYAETWSLCLVEAPTTVDWYNKRLERISWNVTERITDRHKERLQRVISWDIFNELF